MIDDFQYQSQSVDTDNIKWKNLWITDKAVNYNNFTGSVSCKYFLNKFINRYDFFSVI
jgi:hypothetical protein